MKRGAPDLKAQAKRAALNALKRARRTADKAGIELSDWEGEFLGSVEDRLKTYGRAFGDPEKGGAGEALKALVAQIGPGALRREIVVHGGAQDGLRCQEFITVTDSVQFPFVPGIAIFCRSPVCPSLF